MTKHYPTKSSDFSYKDSTDVVYADLSHVGPITRRKFKNSGLDGSEYFTSLEAIKNNNSHMMVVSATPRGDLASVFFGEFSQIGSNFGESGDSMDSPTSMNVNALMADSTDMDKKFAMMEQTIGALKKFVDDKNLYIAQLMNKLEAFTPGESSHVPTCPSSFDQRNKDVKESLAKSKYQKEKQSTSVVALSVQQLQDMITNTIRAQYGGTPQSSLLRNGITGPKRTGTESKRDDLLTGTGMNWTEITEADTQFFPQFGGLTPIEVDFSRKTLEDSLEIDNHKENENDGWTLVTHKNRRHQVAFRIRLPKTRAIRSDINGSSSQKVRRPITLDEFFPKKFCCSSQIGAIHVISSIDETKGSKSEHNPTIT
ncbi:hypothetical protein H5410_057012 [Solanum commersonii]|uniref:Uncharacterized protein n=1 Tax=Solanum commersonii TaxID=4109 RepID=A0A9J5WPP1_SOLCO|nr:hypothetical protein H5410_057012 [Solanum commersonii]